MRGLTTAAALTTLAAALAASPARAQAWMDPAERDEWLLPLEEFQPTQPQAAECRIFVREIGEGPTVVMLHGGFDGELGSLRGLAPLADAGRLVFYDQRGSLRSP